jgi:hypothetical protein
LIMVDSSVENRMYGIYWLRLPNETP